MPARFCLSLGTVLSFVATPTLSVATIELRCLGAQPTIRGTPEDDYLVGSQGRDVIVGLGGDDTILGHRGKDLLCGGGAWDTLKGGRGDDGLDGGNQPDWLVGGPGDDLYKGGAAKDTASFRAADHAVLVDLVGRLARGEGQDSLKQIESAIGSRFADALRGHDGSNSLFGKRGFDRLDGKGGADSLKGFRGHDFLSGGPGDDAGNGGAGKDTCLPDVEGQSSCEV